MLNYCAQAVTAVRGIDTNSAENDLLILRFPATADNSGGKDAANLQASSLPQTLSAHCGQGK